MPSGEVMLFMSHVLGVVCFGKVGCPGWVISGSCWEGFIEVVRGALWRVRGRDGGSDRGAKA